MAQPATRNDNNNNGENYIATSRERERGGGEQDRAIVAMAAYVADNTRGFHYFGTYERISTKQFERRPGKAWKILWGNDNGSGNDNDSSYRL